VARALAALAAAALAAHLTACADPATTVVVYSPLPGAARRWAEDAFPRAHPGWRLRVVPLSDVEALERLRLEAAEPAADAWWGATSWRLAQGAAEGLLASAPPAWAAPLPDSLKDSGGRWTGLLEDPQVIAFSTEAMARSRAPRDWLDLHHPRWSGEIVVPEPGGSDALSALLALRLQEARARWGDANQGLDWFVRLDAWKRSYVPDAEEALRRIRVGSGSLAIVPLSAAEAAREEGGVDYRVPESGSPVLLAGVGLVAGAPRDEGARAFLEWVGAPEVTAELAALTGRLPVGGFAPGARPAWADRVEPGLEARVVPADSVAPFLDEWIRVWRTEVRGRATTLF